MAEMKVELSVADLTRIQNNLESIAERLENGDLLARVGLRIERQAKINATGRPGPMVQTGRLRASINLQLKEGEPVTEAVVGTNVVYAPPVEFGHRVRGHLSKSGVRGVAGLISAASTKMSPAYPFLLPALEQVQSSGEMSGVLGSFGTDIERDWMK